MKTYKTTIHVRSLQEDWVREFEAPDLSVLLDEIREYMGAWDIYEFEINTIITTNGFYAGFVYDEIYLN